MNELTEIEKRSVENVSGENTKKGIAIKSMEDMIINEIRIRIIIQDEHVEYLIKQNLSQLYRENSTS